MYGLIPLGIFHLAISLIAVASGAILLVREKAITAAGRLGQVYVVTTFITCATALGIYQHGGFGRAHILAILTLLALALAVAGSKKLFGKASLLLEIVSFSATFLFHMIPALNEIATRLPYGNPLASSPEEPALKAATGLLLVLFLIGAALQVRRLKVSR
ncbi:MAG: hypothetical protein JNM27_17670 [Leptospirales bacterium]|nr:hypothetical protein [Leptospirales bacterium]